MRNFRTNISLGSEHTFSRISKKVILAFLFISVIDTLTTQIGVTDIGFTEFNLIARFFINELGSTWWMFNLLYEPALLLLTFYGTRFMRLRYTNLKFCSECLLFVAAGGLLINNIYWIVAAM